MARRLYAERNVMNLQDHLSGTEIRLHYRMPTNRERLGYEGMSLQRKGNKVIQNVGEARRRYGLEILVGFGEGDFEKPGPDGTWVPMSSDPKSPHYDPNWKQVVSEQAADLVELMATRVFDMSATALDPAALAEPDPGCEPEAAAVEGGEDPGKNF